MTTSRSDRGRPRLAGWLAVMCIAASPGCAWTLRLSAVPAAAHAVLADGTELALPTTLRIDTLEERTLVVTHPGYLPLKLDLRRGEGTLVRRVSAAVWLRGQHEIEVLLQPEEAPIASGAATP